jgi:hypothetical protein
MKLATFAAVLMLLVPTVASAGHYDRGERYRSDRTHDYRSSRSSSSRFDISFGFGSGGYRDYSYANVRYGRGYTYPRYYSPPVVYRQPVYYHPAPPPVIYHAPPPRIYYSEPCYSAPYYYSETRYYYGR